MLLCIKSTRQLNPLRGNADVLIGGNCGQRPTPFPRVSLPWPHWSERRPGGTLRTAEHPSGRPAPLQDAGVRGTSDCRGAHRVAHHHGQNRPWVPCGAHKRGHQEPQGPRGRDQGARRRAGTPHSLLRHDWGLSHYVRETLHNRVHRGLCCI